DSMSWETDKWAKTISERGYELENHYIGPTSQDSAAQLQSLADALALNPDILCVVPIAADAVDAQLAVAKANGTIVVTHEGSTLKNINYNVDAFTAKAFGEHFADLFVQYGGDKGKIAITVGSLTEVSHNQWADAMYKKMQKDYPGWVSITGGDFIESGATDSAYEVGKQLIQDNKDLTAIFVGSASATMGFCRAVEELGKKGEILIIGCASAAARADAWKAGTVTHSCFWYPGYSAAAAYEVALRVLEGKEIKTGDNLGIEGFENIIVEGTSIYGSGWFDVTAENWEKMAELM
ncbi:MAG: substrate-binding domain-containing protein, partial [Oscillospiraceae bacterium]